MTQAAPEIYTETITPSQGGDPVSFRMIKVEGGEFMMGSEDTKASSSERPIHPVIVSPFWMSEYLVTQTLWQTVLSENPAYFFGLDRPIENVSWRDITERFLPALNQCSRLKYRLPTEAEWEYAARGGKHKSIYQYSGSNRLKDVAWYSENSHWETKAVGLKQPNILGLYDLSGNVYEWCEDWYDSSFYQNCFYKGTVKNPIGPRVGRHRVLRGGSWNLILGYCRISYRLTSPPESKDSLFGFRLVASFYH